MTLPMDEDLIHQNSELAASMIVGLHNEAPELGTLAFMIGMSAALGNLIAVYADETGASKKGMIRRAQSDIKEYAQNPTAHKLRDLN